MLKFHWFVIPLRKLYGHTPTSDRPLITFGSRASPGMPSRMMIREVALGHV